MNYNGKKQTLFWECGMICQAFYLAGESAGFQGCGIGCFFDDTVHRMRGLSGSDARLTDLPAYD